MHLTTGNARRVVDAALALTAHAAAGGDR